MDKNLSRVIEIDINDILPNRNQPRIVLNEEDDLGLTDSIKEYGVLQPILVRSIGDKYEIIAGERRYRASVLAGKETIPAIIISMNDKESAEVALIENVQRKDLSPIEEALSYKSILDKGYMTQEQLAEKIGKSQPTIANKIRLLNLSDEVQDALLENKISERHARSLLKLKSKQDQNSMLDKIIEERLTVRKLDDEIEKMIKEKGEDSMNNNEFNNMPQFQSFASAPVETPVPQFNVTSSVPEVQPVAPVAPAAPVAPQIDIFANATANQNSLQVEEPVQTPVSNPYGDNMFEPVGTIEPTPAPSVPQFDIFANAQPTIEPVQPAAPTSQFDIFANAQPTIEPAVEPAPASIEPQIDTFQVAPQPVIEQPVVQPAAPVEPQIDLFQAAPQPVVQPVQPEATNVQSLDSFTTAPVQENSFTQPAPSTEPIIITDYNKQYDPVMPVQESPVAPQASFKEVIAAIRECANKIESYGYKIDVDEFDLTNIYQAIFKIEKM